MIIQNALDVDLVALETYRTGAAISQALLDNNWKPDERVNAPNLAMIFTKWVLLDRPATQPERLLAMTVVGAAIVSALNKTLGKSQDDNLVRACQEVVVPKNIHARCDEQLAAITAHALRCASINDTNPQVANIHPRTQQEYRHAHQSH